MPPTPEVLFTIVASTQQSGEIRCERFELMRDLPEAPAAGLHIYVADRIFEVKFVCWDMERLCYRCLLDNHYLSLPAWEALCYDLLAAGFKSVPSTAADRQKAERAFDYLERQKTPE